MSIDKDGVVLVYIFVIALIMLSGCLKVRSISFIQNNFRKSIAGLYFSLLLGVTLCPIELPPQDSIYSLHQLVNYIPFSDLKQDYINWMNVFGNIALFIPLIPLLKYCADNISLTLKKSIYISCVISLFIEFMQLFENITGLSGILGRQVDITDIFYNTIGGIAGYFFWVLFQRICYSTPDE
jgi:glycopeptide antibiotics resistance protein